MTAEFAVFSIGRESFSYCQYLWVSIFQRDIAIRYSPEADWENYPIVPLTPSSLFLVAPGTQSIRVNARERHENYTNWVPCFLTLLCFFFS
jgi:hypothetical protein